MSDLEVNLNLDISTFIKRLGTNQVLKVNLSDCSVNIKGNIIIDSVKIRNNNNFESTLNQPVQVQTQTVQNNFPNFPIKLMGKKRNAKKSFVSISQYRFREKMGLINRFAIKEFDLVDLLNYFTPDIMPKDVIDELGGLEIKKLGQLTGIGILGLRYKLTQKYGMEPDAQFLGRMVHHIRKTFGFIGLKFSNKHPHNENDDGSPKHKSEAV